jgi:ATP-binding cassette, subfamily B, heavy metal transporter
MNADEILVMDDGRIIERGTHANCCPRRSICAMWRLQQQEEAASAGVD